MIVIGSYAAVLLGIPLSAADIDLLATEEELQQFVSRNSDKITCMRSAHSHRHQISMCMKNGDIKIEIDTENSPSDQLLYTLCNEEVLLFGVTVKLPDPNLLYLIKKAAIASPPKYRKTIIGLLALKPYTTIFSEQQIEFYRLRKAEISKRYNTLRRRFSLSVSNEDFFAASDHVRTFVHDDIHRAIAFYPREPLFERCKHDLSSARIHQQLFLDLNHDDQIRMMQEEFIVIGIERFYLHDQSLSSEQVYLRGLHKTVRDLFIGFFQEFCIDHLQVLLNQPEWDYLHRFNAAVSQGLVRRLVKSESQSAQAMTTRLGELIQNGDNDLIRTHCEDVLRRGQVGDSRPYLYHLGIALLRQKYCADASKCLERALSLGYDKPDLFLWLAKSYLMQGKNDAALPVLHRAMRYRGTSQEALRLFSRLRRQPPSSKSVGPIA